MVKRGFTALMLLGMVTGCAGLPTSQKLFRGEVQVIAPQGYCVHSAKQSSQEQAAVVLIGKCAQDQENLPAVISLTLGGPGSGGLGSKALVPLFASAEGRGLLARDGQPRSVKIRHIQMVKDILLLHVDDRQIGEYWRAIFLQGSRLVTISVWGPGQAGRGNFVKDPQYKTLLLQSIAAFQAANA